MEGKKTIDLLTVSAGSESESLEAHLAAERDGTVEHPFPGSSFQASGNAMAIYSRIQVAPPSDRD